MLGVFGGRTLATAVLILAVLPGEAQAQKRVFARVQPDANGGEKLNFDVNQVTSDNVAPNLVVAADGKRGFVSYGGSGAVMAFSLLTGEILARIKTGGAPAFATPLPGGRALAVVSVLENKVPDNKVFLIDMDASELRSTFTFPDAKFGFGSIVSASPDGTIGYVSSTGTGEVIKFSLADGAELGRFKGMQGPAQITVTPDGATILVVDTLTEEVLFIDAANLTKKATLKGKDSTVNFTIFNKPVLSPDGSTGIIAARTADTVLHFRTSDGEILDTATIGTAPGFTTLTPDGKHWAILNDLSLTLIGTEDFKDLKDLTTVKGGPLGSANIVFSPDSRYAFYASSSSDLIFQHDLQTGAVVAQVLVGDSPNQVLDEPATLAATPDGKIVAAVDFVSNNIELLTDAFALDAARFISSAEEFTGLTLINLSDKTANFTITALDNYGDAVTGEGIQNPAAYSLPPNNQISLTVAEIFKFDNKEERIGWLAIVSDQPDVAGYLSTGNGAVTNLDGAPLFRGVLHDFIIPEVVRKEGKFAQINFVNPNLNQGATFDLRRILKDGTEQDVKTGQQAFPTNRQPQVFGEQFTQPEEVSDGYLRVTAPMGLLMTEFFGSDAAIGALNGIDMDAFAGVTKIFSPQFAVFPGFKTILNVINGSGEDAEVTVTLHTPDGKVLGNPFKTSLVKGAQIKDDLAEMFKDQPEVNNVAGWIEVESTKDRVVGDVMFTNNDETVLTGFALGGTPMARFLFPFVAQDSMYETGMALLNPNDVPATVTLELWAPGGTLDRSIDLTLDPKMRTSMYLSDYFPQLEPHLGGNLRVRSSQPLYAFALINDATFNFIAALPPIPFP